MFIQDDYCPDKKLLQELSDKAKWQELAGRFHWWDGWWAGEPRNTWEYIIKMIWEAQGVEGKIAGFEYWCNILESDNQQTNHLGWHRDKDELLKEESGEIKSCTVLFVEATARTRSSSLMKGPDPLRASRSCNTPKAR